MENIFCLKTEEIPIHAQAVTKQFAKIERSKFKEKSTACAGK